VARDGQSGFLALEHGQIAAHSEQTFAAGVQIVEKNPTNL